MLKAVRRIRSNRPVIDAVVGQPRIHAGNGKDREDGERRSDSESEGAHGPTPLLDPKAVIPDSVSEAGLHDVARSSKPSRLLGLEHGNEHVVGHGAQIHIVDIPPVWFPDGRNPYLNRPLPPPPPPKLTTASSAAALVAVPVSVSVSVSVPVRIAKPIMPARPSTSSGPDSSRTSGLSLRLNSDKRLSKDDMALTTQMGMVRTKNGLQPYRVGFKGGALPTPEPSPNTMAYSPMPAPSFVPARVMTPESLSSGEIQIGMALGSPSHASFQAGWQPQFQSQSQSQIQAQPQGMFSPPLLQQPQTQPQRTPELPIQRQKTQKRRLFGLFGRKNVEPPKAEVIEANGFVVSITENSSPSWQVDSTPGRSNTVAGKKSTKYKPLMRSGTEPDMGNAVESQSKGAAAWSNNAPQLSGPGLLDVEIPDIRLERYSIMFSGVLNQQGGAAPASSLLARRQATLEKLKTINDKIQDEEDDKVRNKYRRATSPQPTKSPVFILFPTTTNSGLTPRASSSRLRSNTSPALLPSPSKPTFDKPTPRKEKKTVTIVSPRAMDERVRAAQVEQLREQHQRPQQPQTVISSGFRFGPEESALILDSPQSISDDGRNFSYTLDREVSPPPTTNPFKPTIPEPQWTMISTPTPSISSESTKRTVLSSSASSSTLSSQVTRPSSPPPVEEDDADLKAAVEISIARQISISRQQRQLLASKTVQKSNTIGNGGKKMLTVNTGNGKMVSRSASSPNSMAAQLASKGQVTRVAETRLGVPRLVVAEGAKRKSERIVLEG